MNSDVHTETNPFTFYQVRYMKRPSFVGIIFFLLAPLLFASNMLVARWINQSIPPITLAFARWLIAALVLLPFILTALNEHLPVIKQHIKQLALLALFGGALSVAPQYGAAHSTSAGHIALIFAFSPVLVSLLNRIIWKIKLTPYIIMGACIAFIGIGIAVFEGDIRNIEQFNVNTGDCLALVAAFAWAAYTALLKHHPVHIPPFVLLWCVAAGGALFLLPALPVEWHIVGAAPRITFKVLGGILFVALVAGIAAYLVYGRIIALYGAAKASMSMYLIPIYAFCLGSLLLDEQLHLYHLLSTCAVFGGVILASLSQKPAVVKVSSPE